MRARDRWSSYRAFGLLLLPFITTTQPATLKAAPQATPTVAAAAPANPELDKVREAIKGLHDRYDRQGEVLERITDELKALTKRIEDDLRPSTFNDIKSGVGSLVRRLSDLQEALSYQASLAEKHANTQTAYFAHQAEQTRLLSDKAIRQQALLSALEEHLQKIETRLQALEIRQLASCRRLQRRPARRFLFTHQKVETRQRSALRRNLQQPDPAPQRTPRPTDNRPAPAEHQPVSP
jgi:molybdopterin converting factor small subunit